MNKTQKMLCGSKKPYRGHAFGPLGVGTAVLLSCALLLTDCKKLAVDEQTGANTGTKNQGAASAATGDEFTIAVIPDTQYYTAVKYGGTQAMFQSQITWIKNNKDTENIVYVIGVGDITDHGDNPTTAATEWANASTNGGYYSLETAITGLPHGIPYGLAVGNHDQYPTQYPLTSTTTNYNAKFGVSHFAGRAYYGGHYGSDNDSHFDLFSAGGIDFIAIYIEYDFFNEDQTAMNTWAYNLCGTYASRKAIIVSHYILNNNGTAGTNMGTPAPYDNDQGLALYTRLKSRSNVFLMLSGHIGDNGEGFRQDTYNGRTIKAYMSDYQGREGSPGVRNGGGGFMRLMKFSKNNDLIKVRTYSPFLNQYETDGDSQFDKPLFHEPTTTRTNDYNNNGKSELALYTPSSGTWKSYGNANVTWGQSGDIPVQADYDGDGKTDVAIWRPSDFSWHISTITDVTYGAAGDIPVPADYNGDGRAEVALWRPSNFQWYLYDAPDVVWGTTGDIPVPGDYDGDGKVDVATWRPSNGNWYVKDQTTINYGLSGDIPVPGDYDGDGMIDRATYRPSTNQWWINGAMADIIIGQAGDIPAPGDYFGDGKTHQAVFRPSTNTLYMYNNGTTTSVTLGASGDKLLNLPYHIRKFFYP